MRLLILSSALLLLSACNRDDSAAPAGPEVNESQAAGAAATRAEASRVEEKDDLLEFTYSWPAEVSAIPALATRLAADRDASRAKALKEAQEDRAERPADAPFFPHSLNKKWVVAGNSPRLLSIDTELEFFTGGAHPNRLFESIIWDRQSDREVQALDLFTSPTAARTAITRLYCPALDRLRQEKRGDFTMPDGMPGTECPDLGKQRIVPTDTDSNGRFDTLVVKLPPYEAGPYAEGSYLVDLPATDEWIAMMKPEHRASFEAQGQ